MVLSTDTLESAVHWVFDRKSFEASAETTLKDNIDTKDLNDLKTLKHSLITSSSLTSLMSFQVFKTCNHNFLNFFFSRCNSQHDNVYCLRYHTNSYIFLRIVSVYGSLSYFAFDYLVTARGNRA